MPILHEAKVYMTGLAGVQKIDIPSNYQSQIRFITIVNITDNSVCLYPLDITAPTDGRSVICLGAYAVQTIPIVSEIIMGFNVIYTNPTGSNPDKKKTVKLQFTEENLNLNCSMAPSFTAGGNVVNTKLVQIDPAVDLATETTAAAMLALLQTIDVDTGALAAILDGAHIIGGVYAGNITKDWLDTATADAYTDIDTPWIKPGHKSAIIQIRNTHAANGIKVKVLGSADGIAYDKEILAETVLAALAYQVVNVSDYYPYIKIQAASNVAGTPGNVKAEGAAIAI